jgi:hypothetical protein
MSEYFRRLYEDAVERDSRAFPIAFALAAFLTAGGLGLQCPTRHMRAAREVLAARDEFFDGFRRAWRQGRLPYLRVPPEIPLTESNVVAFLADLHEHRLDVESYYVRS